jgi:hypothetical protein
MSLTTKAVTRSPGWSRSVIGTKNVIWTENGGQLKHDTVALCNSVLNISKEHCCVTFKGRFIGLLLLECFRDTCQIHASAALPWLRELQCASFAENCGCGRAEVIKITALGEVTACNLADGYGETCRKRNPGHNGNLSLAEKTYWSSKDQNFKGPSWNGK